MLLRVPGQKFARTRAVFFDVDTSPRVLIVSPIKNEAAHLEAVIRAVAAQELPPTRWIVVDDGSSDGTSVVARRLAADIPFMDVLVEDGGSPGRDPLAEGAAPKAFNRGLALVDVSEFTHVMKLDGDVELPPDYLRRLMAEFANDPGLGIACGDLVEGPPESRARIPIPAHHVHGALKCYTLKCFQAIGGLQERWAGTPSTRRTHGCGGFGRGASAISRRCIIARSAARAGRFGDARGTASAPTWPISALSGCPFVP